MDAAALLIAATLSAGTPFAIAALGLLVNERAGVVNLGAEGMMLIAAVAGFAVAIHTGSDLLAIGGGGNVPTGPVLIVLVAAASWGFGSVLGHRLLLPRRALLGAAMEMLVGGVVLLIVAACRGEFSDLDVGAITGTSWFAWVWLIVPGSILAFTAYGYALGHLPVVTVSSYAYVNPVVAVILGALFVNESLSVREGIGALIIVASVAALLTRRADVPPAVDGEATPGAGEVALAGLGSGVMATHLTLDAGYLQPGHSHPDHESIGFVLSGRIRMVVDDSEAVLEPGDAWWHPRGQYHVTEALAPSTAIEIHTPLRPDVLERLGLA